MEGMSGLMARLCNPPMKEKPPIKKEDLDKVTVYMKEKIDFKRFPAISRLITHNPEQTAKSILNMLLQDKWPIDQQHVGSEMIILEIDLGH